MRVCFSKKTCIAPILVGFALVSCGPKNYDNYETFYNALDLSSSIDTEGLASIQGHTILFPVSIEKSGINIYEICTKSIGELHPNIPLTDNYIGEKCQQRYLINRENEEDFCFHFEKREMRDEFDDYETVFDDTSGLITIDNEQAYHLFIINTDNDEEHFITYFSVENISISSCDDFK